MKRIHRWFCFKLLMPFLDWACKRLGAPYRYVHRDDLPKSEVSS